jgi:hypothetical protein
VAIVELIHSDFRTASFTGSPSFDATYAELPYDAAMEARYRQGAQAYATMQRGLVLPETSFDTFLDEYIAVASAASGVHFAVFADPATVLLDALDRNGIHPNRIDDLDILTFRPPPSEPPPARMIMWVSQPPAPNVPVIADPLNWLDPLKIIGTGWTVWDMTCGAGEAATELSDAGFIVYGCDIHEGKVRLANNQSWRSA